MEDYIQQVLAFDVRAGRAGARREDGRAVHLARPRDQRDADRRGPARAALPGVRRRVGRARVGVGRSCGRSATCELPARTSACSCCCGFHIAHVLQVCSRHTADLDAGVPARGLNGEAYRGHVFWDELYVYPFLNFRLPDDHPRAAHVPLPPARRGAGGGPRGGLPGRDVPVAERQRRHRGDPGRPPQPALGPVGARPQPQPAARQRRDLLQRLAVLPGHRRPRVPARLRRRDDARDRALLGLDRALQPRARPLRDPRRDGPGRVPREATPAPTEGGLRNNAYTNVMVAWICEHRAAACSTCCPRAAAAALRARLGLDRRRAAHAGRR